MAETYLEKADFVKFTLSCNTATILELEEEPGGWKDDELEIVRNEEYHGIFTQITNDLSFYGEAKDYILNAFKIGGLNTDVILTKYQLTEVDGEVKYMPKYMGIADFNTMTREKNYLKVKFNSNQLEELIKAHRTDTFELERSDSIDSENITALEPQEAIIDGRTLVSTGTQKIDKDWYELQPWVVDSPLYLGYPFWTLTDDNYFVPQTVKVIEGPPRHADTENQNTNWGGPAQFAADMFCYANETTLVEPEWIMLEYTGRVRTRGLFSGVELHIIAVRVVYDGAGDYDIVEEKFLDKITSSDGTNFVDLHGYYIMAWNDPPLAYNEAIGVMYKVVGGDATFDMDEHFIKITSIPEFDYSKSKFLFIDEAYDRLLEIITGDKNRFLSKTFGRREWSNGDLIQHGKYSFHAITCGYWIREFDSNDEKYKGIQLSFRDLFESTQAMFNVGAGVVTFQGKQVFRLEALEYFYQREVGVKLPFQISNVKRSVDEGSYFSAIEIGTDKGGDYENEIGLDEPNTKTDFVTPIRKSDNKYVKVSNIRADEYGMEIIRRKPYNKYPTEDTSSDDHLWFLDLRANPTSTGASWRQRSWDENPSDVYYPYNFRLQGLPTGILNPTTYHNFMYTPVRMLERHGWVIRGSMNEPINQQKFIKYISSKANTTLATQFEGDVERIENEDYKVIDLEPPRFYPEIIEFDHPVSDELMEEILATTQTEFEGGLEDIPNVYFKFEWVNENGDTERGYLLNLKPKNSGRWKMLKAVDILSSKGGATANIAPIDNRVVFEGGIIDCQK